MRHTGPSRVLAMNVASAAAAWLAITSSGSLSSALDASRLRLGLNLKLLLASAAGRLSIQAGSTSKPCREIKTDEDQNKTNNVFKFNFEIYTRIPLPHETTEQTRDAGSNCKLNASSPTATVECIVV